MKQLLQRLPTHLWVAAAGWASRAVMAAVQLLSIPLLYRLLGVNDFAVFSVMTGLMVWFSLADFGIGTALQNMISEYKVQQKAPEQLLISILPLLLVVGIVEVGLLMAVSPFVQRWLFSNIHSAISPHLLVTVGVLYVINFLLGVSFKVFFAFRKGYWSYLYQALGYVSALMVFLILLLLHLPLSLMESLTIWIGMQIIFSLIGFVHAFPIKINFIPHMDFTLYRYLIRRAIPFFAFSVSANAVLSIDYIVMVKLLPPNEIVVYTVMLKIFNFILFCYSGAILSALWPVLAEQYASGKPTEAAHANRQLLRNIAMGMIYVVVAMTFFMIFRRWIIGVFGMHNAVQMAIPFIACFGVYGCLRVWTDSFSMVLQCRGQMRIFVWAVPLQALTSIVSMIVLAKIFGLYGVVFAFIICFVSTVSWILPYWHYRLLKEKRNATA